MKRLCPTIGELLSFEASARYLSFTRAADELCVTQGAVSRQVAALENFLGVEVFQRVRKRLVLTQAGQSYLAKIQPCLDQLQAATLEILAHGGSGGVLHLSSLPTFAAKFLIPRLPDFSRAHPNIVINFIPHTQGYDFSNSTLDAAIRFGDGVWPRAVSDYLIGRKVVPVCGPALASGKDAIRAPQDLAKQTLLQHVSVPRAWEEWFAALGHPLEQAMRGPRFDQFTLLIQAAQAGLGVALVPRFLAEEDLRAGRIVVAYEADVESALGFYLVYPEEKRRLPSVVAFRAWLLELCAASSQGTERGAPKPARKRPRLPAPRPHR